MIEEILLVIGHVRARFVIADGHAVVMCLEELATQADVVDLGGVAPEIGWEVQGQVVDRVEGDDPGTRINWDLIVIRGIK